MKTGAYAKSETNNISLLRTNFSVELMEDRFHGMATLISLPDSNAFLSTSPN
jgi:hypothetical protein